jgi:hypothetical protein
MLVPGAAPFRALANLAQPVWANEQSVGDRQAQSRAMNAKEITKRSANVPRPGSFIRYAEMVERLSARHTQHLVLRLVPPKRAP